MRALSRFIRPALTLLTLTAAGQFSLAAAQETALDDPTIVAIFDATNTADIETGKLAAERAGSDAVRQFGAMLARDHQAVRQQGRDLAKKLGVTPTPPTDQTSAREHAAMLRKLGKLQGSEFDRAFLEHEERFHRNVIAAVKSTLLPAIRNPELRELVIRVVPAFQAHMRMAQNLAQQLATK